MKDERGIVLNIGAVTLLGLFLIALPLMALALRGYDIDSGALWDWSWLLFAAGALMLTARAMGMNVYALILIPLGAGALWFFGVMGGVMG